MRYTYVGRDARCGCVRHLCLYDSDSDDAEMLHLTILAITEMNYKGYIIDRFPGDRINGDDEIHLGSCVECAP